MRVEEIFVTGVEANKAGKKGDGCGGEIEDVVGEDLGFGEDFAW